MKDYSKLQNGSDIRGIAIVDRGLAFAGKPVKMPNLTSEAAEDIARGFLAWLCRKTGKQPEALKLAIGRDPRITGKTLMDGLMRGFGPYGCQVLDCGLASTPAMFMATIFPEFACDGTIMITASHLPFDRNGFKFFTRDGGLDKQDIKDILEFAADDAKSGRVLGAPCNADGAVHRSGEIVFLMEEADLMARYSAHLRQLIIDGCGMGDKPLKDLKIAVDAGNGAGGFYARKVLRPLGADISGSRYLDPDGMFENHIPNPEDKEVMQAAAMQTLVSGSDLGLIFDTDVDRSAAVDSKGWEISRNGIVALAAALVAEEYPGTTIVTDSITSRQLTEFLETDLGLKHLRFKRGYRNVINKAIELNEAGTDCQLAIETSGHAALKENYFLDDGAYLATKIVIHTARLKAEGKRLDMLLEGLGSPAEEKEIRIPVTEEDFAAYGDRVLTELEAYIRGGAAAKTSKPASGTGGAAAPDVSDASSTGGAAAKTSKPASGTGGAAAWPTLEEPNYEGVRINFPEGWCLLRKSLHDPLLPMNIAADEKGGCQKIRAFMADFLSGYEGLDNSVL